MYYLNQFCLFVVVLHSANAINFQNNVCRDIFSYHFSAISSNCYHNPDVLSNDVTSISKRHGYNAVTFSVTTNDGYILNLYRISPNKEASSGTTKFPVFVLHGIAINVQSWIDIGDRSLAFNLADRGYDVWLGTIRGTMNANKHKTLTVDDPNYWNFNLDTLTKEDASIQFEFVANITKQKVVILAHSMGATLSFIYASEYTERANHSLKGIIAMAPAVYLNDILFLKLIIPWGIPLIQILKALNVKGLLYHEKLVHNFETLVCATLPELCYFLVSTVSGKTKQFLPEDLPLFTSHWPSGVSVYILEHFLQISRDRRFQKFNYGTRKNNEIYGTPEPPLYNLSKIQIPVYLFYGKHDTLYKEKNIERLFKELGSRQKDKISVPRNASEEYDYSHVDFIWSKNLHNFLYNDLFEKLDSFISET